MDKYKIGQGFSVHTCRITLMEREFVGHVTFEIGGNARGTSILNAAIDYLYDLCDMMVAVEIIDYKDEKDAD